MKPNKLAKYTLSKLKTNRNKLIGTNRAILMYELNKEITCRIKKIRKELEKHGLYNRGKK